MRGRVYMIAIGGVGMSALANLFTREGYKVSGSDRAVYPPVSDFLEEIDVPVLTPFSSENIPSGTDFVIIGNAVSKDNPEVNAVEKGEVRKYSLPSALFKFFIQGRQPVVVAGTHGKTTTSSMMAHILHHAGLDPSFFVGGIPLNFQVPSGVGRGTFFVVEGDEYDSAYFDKKAKFYHYNPRYLILTSIEYDHADIYPDLATMKDAFRDLVEMVPAEGIIVACSDYPAVLEVLTKARCRVLTYSSRSRGGDVYLERGSSGGGESKGRISWGGRSFEIVMKVPGDHNMVNGMAAAVCAVEMGVSPGKALSGLREFKGVKRRMEEVGCPGGIRVVDDFAHHPTAVKETIEGGRDFFRPLRVVAIFEPRSNTSRKKIFEKEYAKALSRADLALICPPHRADAISREERFSPERVSRLIRGMGGKSIWFDDLYRIPPFLAGEGKRGDLLLFMSNGDMGGIQKMTYRLLEKGSIISMEGNKPEEDHD